MIKLRPRKTVIWAAIVNLSGLADPSDPIRMVWQEDLKMYWSKCGNLHVNGPGSNVSPGYRSFASYKKSEIVLWIRGAKAVMSLLKSFAG